MTNKTLTLGSLFDGSLRRNAPAFRDFLTVGVRISEQKNRPTRRCTSGTRYSRPTPPSPVAK
nr:MAG TPA: hypothetical protein [Caudoviricetes sp.]